MSNQGETYQRISVPDAAKLLGISAATVRRRIRDGSLQAERVHRPQGITYVVLVGSNHSNQDDRSKSNHEEEITARLKQSGAAPAADAMVSLIQTTIGTVLGPLVAEQAALRQTVERQTEQLISQAETIGRQSERVAALELETTRQRAELVAGNHRHSPGAAQQTPEAPAPATNYAPVPLLAHLRALMLWLLATLAIVAVIGLLAWPR